MKGIRQLTVDDAAEYHKVLIAGYAENKNYPISFDAINFSQEESRAWILKYPVFGLYVDGSLVCFISFRMPWIPKATPDVYPHIAHFVTDPEHKGKGYAREVLAEAEDLLRNVYKTPAVTLGTAAEHLWLAKMYEGFAFKEYKRKQLLGKVHITIFFKKYCSYQDYCVFKDSWNKCKNKKSRIKGCDSFLYPVSIYNYFVTILRSTGILASTASPLIIF